MTDLLIRLFIGKDKNPAEPAVRARYASLAGFTGIFLNLLLFVGKLTVGILASSLAIVADAFNNVADAGSAIVSLIGFRLANKPVDKEHPLGHGRLEYVSGFIVDMLIILVGFELFTSSFDKILHPEPTAIRAVTYALLGASILVKAWLFFFYRRVGNRIQSVALKASATDSLSDCIATGLVIAAAVVASVWGISVDGYAGLLVSVFILLAGAKAAKETIDLLLGSPPDPAFIKDIYDFSKRYSQILGIHDVMVHDYGPGRKIVSFHAEVSAASDINVAHEEVDQMERDMHEAFGCIVTIHLDPIVTDDPLTDELCALAAEAAKSVQADLTIHDFRITRGETNVNLIFDLLLPADCKLSAAEAEHAVACAIAEKRSNCRCVIRAEHSFV